MSTPALAPDPLDGAFSAAWLMRQHIPPVEYVVPGLIPEGLTMLAAAPKVGKSWFVLGIALAAAEGGKALGTISVNRRPVLYLALEDGERRLQNRLRTIGVTTGPDNLLLMPDVDPAIGALPIIQTFLERYGDQKPMVILDTLGKIRGTYGGNDAYGNDYTQMSALKDLVDAVPGSSLIVVHHTNKGEKTDFLDSVSGTQGLAGAADSILVIQRERNSTEAALHVTSRDAAEGKYAMIQDGGTTWRIDGNGLQQASERAALQAVTGGVGDDMAELVATVSKYPEGIKPKDLATLLHMEDSKVRLYLRRAVDAGRIANPQRGRYTPVTTETSVTLLDDHRPEVTQVSGVTPLPEGAS